MWTAGADHTLFDFSLDEMDALTDVLDIQSWPVVLELTSRQESTSARRAAIESGLRSLAERKLIVEGDVIDDVVLAVRSLIRPDVEVEVRFIGPDDAPLRRATVCRSGVWNSCVLRSEDRITIRSIDVLSTEMLADRVADIVGVYEPVRIGGISAPTADLVARLDECATATDVAQALHALGAAEADTTAAALAFAECGARVEIVAYELVEGTSTQSSGAVAVYCTPRGAMVTSPSQSSDGRLWTTISPGSSHRIRQAIARLIETLPTGRWVP